MYYTSVNDSEKSRIAASDALTGALDLFRYPPALGTRVVPKDAWRYPRHGKLEDYDVLRNQNRRSASGKDVLSRRKNYVPGEPVHMKQRRRRIVSTHPPILYPAIPGKLVEVQRRLDTNENLRETFDECYQIDRSPTEEVIVGVPDEWDRHKELYHHLPWPRLGFSWKYEPEDFEDLLEFNADHRTAVRMALVAEARVCSRRNIVYDGIKELQRRNFRQPVPVQPPDTGGIPYWEAPDKAGWLWKQGDHIKTWRQRFFVLKSGRLFWFSSPAITPFTRPRGVIDLSRCESIRSAEDRINKPYSLELSSHRGTLYFLTVSNDDKEDWINVIGRAIITRSRTLLPYQLGESPASSVTTTTAAPLSQSWPVGNARDVPS